MAQGKSKGLQSKKESRHHAARTAAAPKKGKRVIPPKKAAAVKHAALHKVRVAVVSTTLRDLIRILESVREDKQIYRTTDDLCCFSRHPQHHERRGRKV